MISRRECIATRSDESPGTAGHCVDRTSPADAVVELWSMAANAGIEIGMAECPALLRARDRAHARLPRYWHSSALRTRRQSAQDGFARQSGCSWSLRSWPVLILAVSDAAPLAIGRVPACPPFVARSGRFPRPRSQPVLDHWFRHAPAVSAVDIIERARQLRRDCFDSRASCKTS